MQEHIRRAVLPGDTDTTPASWVRYNSPGMATKMTPVLSRPPTRPAIVLVIGAALLLTALLVSWSHGDHATTADADSGATHGIPGGPQDPDGIGPIPTEENLKIAIIGDTGYGANFAAVLNLIEAEGAELIIIEGDFDYADNPDGYFAAINAAIGPDFPVLLAVGNHDIASWPEGCSDPDGCYAAFFKQRLAATGIVLDEPNLNDDMYSTDFGGLALVFTGQTTSLGTDCPANASGYACYIRNQLSTDRHIWRLCNWHKNQQATQVGGKTNEVGWAPYNVCFQMGAMVFNGHEHSYERTKTLTNAETQTVDLEQHPLVSGTPSNPNSLRVKPGASFITVSGLGGLDTRAQTRCLPATYPYGCNKEWANILSTSQTGGASRSGALFLEFYVDGDPYKARGYFKTTLGTVTDQFEITADFQDSDADGLQDALDNCSSWSNPEQQLPVWPVPAGDTDCDGFADTAGTTSKASEAEIGTDASRHCAATPARHDEPLPDAWPLDFDDNQRANIGDFLNYNQRLGAHTGDPKFSVRFDLNPNGVINVGDLLHFNQSMNELCA